MKYFVSDSTYVVRLEPDEGIVESLASFCEREGIAAGYFHGLGAVSRAEVGHFNPAANAYSWLTVSGPSEIVSLYGNITTVDGKPFLHAHIVLGDHNMAVRGGHLKEAVVSVTCEIALVRLRGGIGRRKDEANGLWKLDLEPDG